MEIQLTSKELDLLLTALQHVGLGLGLGPEAQQLQNKLRLAEGVALDEEAITAMVEAKAEAHEQAVAIEGGPYAQLG